MIVRAAPAANGDLAECQATDMGGGIRCRARRWGAEPRVLSAESLSGPWHSTFLSDDPRLFGTNPAPFIFPNGTAIMLTRQKDQADGGGAMRIRVGRAPQWSGPWNYSVGLVETGSEDPHLFYSPHRGGSFHAICESHLTLSS